MDDLTTAFLAKMVAGNLQHVDESTVQFSASGPAKKIEPKNFIPQAMMPNTGYSNGAHHSVAHAHIESQLNAEAMRAYPHTVDVSTSPMLTLPITSVRSESTIDNQLLAEILKTFKSIDGSLKKLTKHFVK